MSGDRTGARVWRRTEVTAAPDNSTNRYGTAHVGRASDAARYKAPDPADPFYFLSRNPSGS